MQSYAFIIHVVCNLTLSLLVQKNEEKMGKRKLHFDTLILFGNLTIFVWHISLQSGVNCWHLYFSSEHLFTGLIRGRIEENKNQIPMLYTNVIRPSMPGYFSCYGDKERLICYYLATVCVVLHLSRSFLT